MVLIIIPTISVGQGDTAVDVWKPLRFLVGSWTGEGNGQSGHSTVTQSYEFMLGGNFLKMQTKSVFEPQEANPDGETHEDFAVFSFDQSRETLVMRAFYNEGYVNTYVLTKKSENGRTLTFETESIENAPQGTKAKVVFTHSDPGKLETDFFVAFPGKEFGCFSTNVMLKDH